MADREHVVSRGLWIAGSIVATIWVLVLVSERPKDDVAWLVYVAGRVLHGDRLYVDLVEVNPPLIVLLSAVPVLFAEGMRVPPLPAFYVAVTAVVVLCAWMAASLLRSYSPFFGDRVRTTAFLVVILALGSGAEFGQREHLFAVLALPYLALLAVRLRGGSVRPAHAAFVGALAGIGFALKPHFLLAFVLLEMGATLRGLRRFRSETAAVVVVLSLYVLAITIFFPAYLTEGMPLVLLYVRAYGGRWERMLLGARYVLALGALNYGLSDDLRERPERGPLLFLLAVFGMAGAVAYLVQWKGWLYHALPCYLALALRAAYALASQPMATEPARRSRRAVGLSILMAGLGLVAFESFVHANRREQAVRELASLVRRDDVRSLLVLSRSVSPAFPVVNQTGVRWASRFDTTWALVAESSLARRGVLSAQRRPVLRQVVKDFVTRQPDLVAVETRHAAEYLDTLSTQPDFVDAWQEYRELDGIVGLRVFARCRSR